jgi:hypothetical protein
MVSFPLWERGLKCYDGVNTVGVKMSLLLLECGLKRVDRMTICVSIFILLFYKSEWIEMVFLNGEIKNTDKILFFS